MADSYESVLCVKSEVFVYRIPARTSNRGYRAAEWKLDEPDWTGRLKVVSRDKDISIKLEDKTSGELFAQCPVESYPSSAVEQVLDSSRYFVVRIQDGNGRNAFIGLGFADRGDSFDLLVAIQDHFKHVKRDERVEQEASDVGSVSSLDSAPKLDLGFKEGQTIKLNFATKKTGETSAAKPRPKASMGASPILLPPPPGGAKLSAPAKPAFTNNPSPSAPISQTSSVTSTRAAGPPASNLDLLVDLGHLANTQSQPSGTADGWDDFASTANNKTESQKNSDKALKWVNFD